MTIGNQWAPLPDASEDRRFLNLRRLTVIDADIYSGTIGNLVVTGSLTLGGGLGVFRSGPTDGTYLELDVTNVGRLKFFSDATDEVTEASILWFAFPTSADPSFRIFGQTTAAHSTANSLDLSPVSTGPVLFGLQGDITLSQDEAINISSNSKGDGVEPTIVRGTDRDTGIEFLTNHLRFWAGNVKINFTTTGFKFPDGSQAAPVIAQEAEVQTGMWFTGTGTASKMHFGADNFEVLQFDKNDFQSFLPIRGQFGSAEFPTHSYSSDPDTGSFRSATNEHGISAGNKLVASFGNALNSFLNPFNLAVSGSVSLAALRLNAADTGLYSSATGIADMTAGGVRTMSWQATGVYNEDALTVLPTMVEGSIGNKTTFSGTTYEFSSAVTVFDWVSGSQAVTVHGWAQCVADANSGGTAAARVRMKLQVSFNGGSSYADMSKEIESNCGNATQGYVIRAPLSVSGVQTGTATGDVLIRMAWRTSVTTMDFLLNYISGQAWGTF